MLRFQVNIEEWKKLIDKTLLYLIVSSVFVLFLSANISLICMSDRVINPFDWLEAVLPDCLKMRERLIDSGNCCH